MKVAQINGGVFGSTGTIMFGIASLAEENGMEMRCFSPVTSTNRNCEPAYAYTKIGSYRLRQLSVLAARLTGKNGCFAIPETKKLIRELRAYDPDVIHLHTLHDSYVNLPLLFHYIKKHHIRTVWTLHDCWALTGHCTHFTFAQCDKWKTGCHHCPQLGEYPVTLWDTTAKMWRLKKEWFTGISDMTVVTPSRWLKDLVAESYLQEYPVKVIPNGIDVSVFCPGESAFKEAHGIAEKKMVLGVASGWNERKGLADLKTLAGLLDERYKLVLIGVSDEQRKGLPSQVLGLTRTNSAKELADAYRAADVFVNPTYEDTFPSVNLEARACQTPIITYDACGAPESAGPGATVIPCGNLEALAEAVLQVTREEQGDFSSEAETLDRNHCFLEYLRLYQETT